MSKAERRLEIARTEQDEHVDLDIENLHLLSRLDGLSHVEFLNLDATKILDLGGLVSLSGLKDLDIKVAPAANLRPILGLSNLHKLEIRCEGIPDLEFLPQMSWLRELDIVFLGLTVTSALLPRAMRNVLKPRYLKSIGRMTSLEQLQLFDRDIVDISPLANLVSLRRLRVSYTSVRDLSPVANLTKLVDGAIEDRELGGLGFEKCPLTDKTLLDFAHLDNPERTIRTINYLRAQQGMTPYERPGNAEPALPSDAPKAIEDVPSPFDFEGTERGTITIAGSDTNIPAFPFASSQEDHARRLEACKVISRDLIEGLSERRYDNVRAEYLSYLRRYVERLPETADSGNMLLADGMARALGHLFAADAEMLPNAFAAELSAMLEQHIAACVYYPEIGTFNRDVRDGRPSRPFPLQAARAFAEAVREYTPHAFEPPVSEALSEAQSFSPPPPVPTELPPTSPQTIKPPAIPGGEIDPKKSREFATATTANRLWKTVQTAAVVSTASRGVVEAAHALSPYAKEIIEWLAEVLKSLG